MQRPSAAVQQKRQENKRKRSCGFTTLRLEILFQSFEREGVGVVSHYDHHMVAVGNCSNATQVQIGDRHCLKYFADKKYLFSRGDIAEVEVVSEDFGGNGLGCLAHVAYDNSPEALADSSLFAIEPGKWTLATLRCTISSEHIKAKPRTHYQASVSTTHRDIGSSTVHLALLIESTWVQVQGYTVPYGFLNFIGEVGGYMGFFTSLSIFQVVVAATALGLTIRAKTRRRNANPTQTNLQEPLVQDQAVNA
eukprot:gnl/Trimastix_PCT/3442.p1 GENE.gnl/Trimastix_PCT/3442~~gnl/Trimastix_PCT/3442.p1  ORF type:complete len:250 (+),score=27.04 gnl/Trimastix_PCT/3442:449-1198(+)